MSRIIHTQKPGQTRLKLLRNLAHSIRTYKQQDHGDVLRDKDVLAFIALTLRAVGESVEQTIEAWEKRGYWIKAERFHQEWSWVSQAAGELSQALVLENWDLARQVCERIAVEIEEISVPVKMRSTTPWRGAWEHWKD